MSEYNFWGEVHVFEVDNGDCQWDLNSVDEYQCWNWYDKFIDDNDFYSAGTYCFEVSITLATEMISHPLIKYVTTFTQPVIFTLNQLKKSQ